MVASTKSSRFTPSKKAPSAPSLAKKAPKPNTSILSFFKKTERSESSLFVEAAPGGSACEDDLYSCEEEGRFNEHVSPVKKRRLSHSDTVSTTDELTKLEKPCDSSSLLTTTPEVKSLPKNGKPRIITPFIMDSDAEDEAEDGPESGRSKSSEGTPLDLKMESKSEVGSVEEKGTSLDIYPRECSAPKDNVSHLKVEESTNIQSDYVDDVLDLDDFDTDAFEGEEMREMLFMREQARLEAAELGGISNDDFGDEPIDDGSTIQSCPVCDGSLAGVSSDDASRHVNSCLDGNPTPLPKAIAVTHGDSPPSPRSEVVLEEVSKRFARAAVPRPGQANPIELGPIAAAPKSAFSKLMSNKAEDSAWASAAAAENASRGRPAYERTCPFYKIMPGLSICVDAFRYGAVEGCQAYFLSHFHSDHYVGLTANWRHGPIYCSKVTGSLVKRQLRTAEKWVVQLDFEKQYDIPGTGASVTMIPANHCPGSSLFIFQKPENKRPNARVRKILHCGDFRACPNHVGHPLLKAETKDALSGKLKRQPIDICYLDTTYLNPRYSFPPQEDVIRACAELCASMSPDPECKDDIWENSAKPSGTQAVSRYFHSDKAEDNAVKSECTKPGQRLLVISGTYSIGKERICVGIAKALGSKIFASPEKIKICRQLGDPELSSLLTSNPIEAQVHMQMLMEIRAETLQEYLNGFKPHFSRIVGFRPSGWNFRPTNGKTIGANTSPTSIATEQILHGKGWRTRFGYKDFVPQRGSTKQAMCFGVPYSEHSSFRELAMFVMGLNIEKIIPTVNVGTELSRRRMKAWIDRWMAERRRGGLLQPLVERQDDEAKAVLWEGKSGQGGGAWW